MTPNLEAAILRIAEERCENTNFYVGDMPDIQTVELQDGRIAVNLRLSAELIHPAGHSIIATSPLQFVLRPEGNDWVVDFTHIEETYRKAKVVPYPNASVIQSPVGSRTLAKAKERVVTGDQAAVNNKVAELLQGECTEWHVTNIGIAPSGCFTVRISCKNSK